MASDSRQKTRDFQEKRQSQYNQRMSLNDSLKAFKSRLRDAPVIAKTTTRHAVPDIPAESADVVPSVFVSQNVSLEEGEGELSWFWELEIEATEGVTLS